MKEFGIGLLGFGTVGAGVVEGLQANADVMTERLGARPVLRAIADLDTESDRGVRVDPALLTTDAEAVVRAADVDVVIELIGGTDIARRLVNMSLAEGKPVVTANKALLSRFGGEIFALAAEKQTDIYFEASVAGAIPIIRALREGLIANRIACMYGILNGTCNYILTRMEADGVAFDEALREAQQQGFAEADPGLDIDGHDTVHKAVILASQAYGFTVPEASVHVEGIRGLALTDIRYAHDLGYRVKLLAVIKRVGDEVEVRVHPTLIPHAATLASVSGVFNAVMVEADMADTTLYYGRGAGRKPTASAVLADVGDVIRNLVSGSPHRVPGRAESGEAPAVRRMQDIQARYYLRIPLLDKPNVLSRVAAVLGENGISIASVLQTEVGTPHVPVVIVTHAAREQNMNTALATIDGLDEVAPGGVRLRIEDLP